MTTAILSYPIIPVFSASCPRNDEDSILALKGYRKTGKIGNTLHCKLYRGLHRKHAARNVVIIKKMPKSVYTYARQCTNAAIIPSMEEDILKESTILYYLTVKNTPTAHSVAQYIDLIESEHNYYLITQHKKKAVKLEQFILTARRHMACGKLSQNEYHKIIKYIFWQIFVLMRWLHADMHCCHLDLRLRNVVLENVAFTRKPNGNLTVKLPISIKLCGFSRSELFKPQSTMRDDDEEEMFRCNKPYDMRFEELLDSRYYDARSADLWSLGMMLYHCVSGAPLLPGYAALTSDQLKQYLFESYPANPRMMDLLCALLRPNEWKGLRVMDILQHPCFSAYYLKYGERIAEKAKTQRVRLKKQKKVLRWLPYYKL